MLISKEQLESWMTERNIDSAYDVNSGQCEEFAHYLHELFPESFLRYTEDYISWDSEDHPGGHCWLYLDGKHYDSESLQGVDDWKDLPIIKRNMANMERIKNENRNA